MAGDAGAPRVAGARVEGGFRAPDRAPAPPRVRRQDLIDRRRLRNDRHDPHGAVAGRAPEGVDLEALLPQRRPPAGGLGRRQARRGNDRRGTDRGGLGVTAPDGACHVGGWRTTRSTAW